jgi:hypothetical protein
MWRGEGLLGKVIVSIVVALIIVNAIIKTHSKYLNYKFNRQLKKNGSSTGSNDRSKR